MLNSERSTKVKTVAQISNNTRKTKSQKEMRLLKALK